MKKIKLILSGFLLILGGLAAQAQVSVTVGTPPPWGPAEAAGVRFYYIPDIGIYFDVNTGEYVYLSNGAWVHEREVPVAYRHYDFYKAYKVPLRDYHGETPWVEYKNHHKAYPKEYNRGQDQKTFGERPHDDHDDHDRH